LFTRTTGMMQRDILQETNVAGSFGCLVYGCTYSLCILRTTPSQAWNGIPFPTAAQMADGDMAIVPQIRIAFGDTGKVNVVVLSDE